MKRIIIVLLAVFLLSIGFYFGYRQAIIRLKPISSIKGAKIAQIISVYPDKIIRFEYTALDNNSPNSHAVNIRWEGQEKGNPEYMIYTGDDSLWGILGNKNITSYSLHDIELDPSLKLKIYKYFLKFPVKEPKENILKLIIDELGLTCSSTESWVSEYQFTWGDQSITFPSTMKGGMTGEPKTGIDKETGLIKQEAIFENIDTPGLLTLCHYQGDLSNVSFEVLQQILKDRKQIDLKIIKSKIRKLYVKSK